MKKKVLTALTLVFAMFLAITVYAFNQTNTPAPTAKKTADCCAKKESCPMKNKQSADKAGCCDKADCCCKGDACPMKKEATGETARADLPNVVFASSGESCCKPGADCCKPGAACCKGKHQ